MKPKALRITCNGAEIYILFSAITGISPKQRGSGSTKTEIYTRDGECFSAEETCEALLKHFDVVNPKDVKSNTPPKEDAAEKI